MKNKSVASILIVGLGQLGLPVAKYVKEDLRLMDMM
jgi:UDP-N-acetyl-D-mannosaminuronate dehydrogenase